MRATSRCRARRRSRHHLPSAIGARCAGALIFLGDVLSCWCSRAVDRPLPDGCGRCRHGFLPTRRRSATPRRCAWSTTANPLAGGPFYVNPSSAAMRAAQHADPPSPELTAIANTPQAYWIVPGSSAVTVGKYTGDAQAAGAMPVLTLYGIPHRDCGSFAAGGMASADDYRAWIDASQPTWAPRGRRSSSNPMHSPWPTACRATSAKNATT